jgi:ABC-type bacteriocin/lantibiotic exporter with double-glycine peptidase domain
MLTSTGNSCLAIPMVHQQDSSWCWAACLEMLFNYHRFPVNHLGKTLSQCEIVSQYLNRECNCKEDKAKHPCKAAVTAEDLLLLLQLNFRYSSAKMDAEMDWKELVDQLNNRQQPILLLVNTNKDWNAQPNHAILAIAAVEDNNQKRVVVQDPTPPVNQMENRRNEIDFLPPLHIDNKICFFINNL